MDDKTTDSRGDAGKRKRVVVTLPPTTFPGIATMFLRRQYVVPGICTGCLKPTNNTRSISKQHCHTRYDYSRGFKCRITSSSSKQMSFKTCPECMAWEKSGTSSGAFFVVFLSLLGLAVGGLTVAKLVGWVPPDSGKLHTLGTLFFCIWYGLLVMGIDQCRKLLHPPERPKNVKPECPCDSVRFGWGNTIVFENLEYGRLFLRLNKEYEKQNNLPRLVPDFMLIKGEEQPVFELGGVTGAIVTVLSNMLALGFCAGLFSWLLLILPYRFMLNQLFGF